MYLLIVIAVVLGVFLFIKIDSKDRKARKEAERVTATVVDLRCKQRLKGDKSILKLSYNSKQYSLFLKKEKDCKKFKHNQKVTAYYSKTFDKLFLDN